MSRISPTKTAEEIDFELAGSARLERRLLRDQSRAERRLIKAARQSEEADDRLARARERHARADSTAEERRVALASAIAAVADARRARELGTAPAGPSTSDG